MMTAQRAEAQRRSALVNDSIPQMVDRLILARLELGISEFQLELPAIVQECEGRSAEEVAEIIQQRVAAPIRAQIERPIF